MTKDKVLKLALEALEDWDSPVALPAIYAIKEALAQDELCSSQKPTIKQGWDVDTLLSKPEQEPLAWTVVGDGKFGEIEIGQHAETDLDACRYWVSRGYSLVPLYTTLPKAPWISLTDDEFLSIVTWRGPVNNPHFDRLEYAKAIEAKLKEKNT